MDNLCHTLAGAAVGEAGLKRRTALGSATLMLASNVPDIDVAVFATDTLAMSFRRGWTHGLLAQLVLPALFAAGMLLVGRLARRARPSRHEVSVTGILLLSYLGTWLHIFMDWLNSYGIRLLKPFSDRWFYGDALYIVDPVLYVLFGAAIVLARRAEARSHRAPWRWARFGLILAAIYVSLMLVSNWWARAVVQDGLERAGRGAQRFMVTPVFADPLRREVLLDMGDRYEKGFVWFDPLPHFRPAGYGVNVNASDPAAMQAARTPRFQAFLMWSRFPFFVVERTALRTVVVINDYRYSGPSGRDGWATQIVELPAGR
jgi:inner membrane protein